MTSNIGALPKGFYSPQALFFCVSFTYVKVGRTLESRHIWHEVVQARALLPPPFPPPDSLSSLMPALLTHTYEHIHADASKHPNSYSKSTGTFNYTRQYSFIGRVRKIQVVEKIKRRFGYFPLDAAPYFGILFFFISASRFPASFLLPLSALPF